LYLDGIVRCVISSPEYLMGHLLSALSMQISIDQLRQANVSVKELETTIVKRLYDEFPEASPLTRGSDTHRRLSKQDQSRLANLKPAFVQKVCQTMVDQLHPCSDGVVVTSNSRLATDELVVNAARLAGARVVVMELANLFPSLLEVDALFAPSHFSLRHPSVVSNLITDRKFVVSTGVNTDVFAPLQADTKLHQPLAEVNDSSFVIGVVGRLNTDKCVGVLIATARALRAACSFCKIRVVGDGTLKVHLKALAAEWDLLDSTVEFVDGIFNDEAALAAELRKMHVYAAVAPETLGIAVLEAMSTGVPVVGFIFAGTTEFLVDGYNCVGVTERSAEAFSDAIMTLVRDPKLREEMGRNARKTVEQRFSRDESIREIAMLYQSLAQG
jgi:glycosyltransferase involved in cell wall biosynthesis